MNDVKKFVDKVYNHLYALEAVVDKEFKREEIDELQRLIRGIDVEFMDLETVVEDVEIRIKRLQEAEADFLKKDNKRAALNCQYRRKVLERVLKEIK